MNTKEIDEKINKVGDYFHEFKRIVTRGTKFTIGQVNQMQEIEEKLKKAVLELGATTPVTIEAKVTLEDVLERLLGRLDKLNKPTVHTHVLNSKDINENGVVIRDLEDYQDSVIKADLKKYRDELRKENSYSSETKKHISEIEAEITRVLKELK